MSFTYNRMMSRRRLVAGSVGAMLAGVAVAVPASTSGQMYPGTTVHGVDVSGLTPASSEALLRATFAPLERHAVTYTFDGRSWRASLAEIGMAIDYEAMIACAMAHGRDGSVVDRYSAWVDGGARDVPIVLERDEAVLLSVLERIDGEIAVAPRNARLVAGEDGVSIVDHVAGRRLDLERAIADTKREVCDARTANVALVAQPVSPSVTSENLKGAGRDAARLVREPVFFTHAGATYPVGTDDLLAALAIERGREATLDVAKLAPRLDAIARAVAVPARNVMVGWNDGLYVVEREIDGAEVDREALEAAVLALAASDARTAELPMRTVRAEAREDNLDELGLDGPLAAGSSSFAGSSDSRHANVVAAAENISYKLVAPKARFSFNELLGPIAEENGFVSGSIIQGNWEASDIGGGVCQVSTTVFRAAANAGFQFAEWHPHSWRLGFYELDGSPPGFDGAIYQPNTPDEIEKDLVFENPLDSWLLLMMVIDGATVRAHLYGRDPGWTVALGEARLSEPKPIPEPVERVNPTLARGERVKVQNAKAGVTVRIRRTVTGTDGMVVADGDFVSDYRSVPEAWEIGPS